MATQKSSGDVPQQTRIIPENFVDTGRCFNGLFRTRNLIEGAVMASPVAYVTTHLELPMNQKSLSRQLWPAAYSCSAQQVSTEIVWSSFLPPVFLPQEKANGKI